VLPKVPALSQQQSHLLKRLVQSWHGFLVAQVSVVHSKLVLLRDFFQADARSQIQRLA
jgi:hypothetical protein